MAPCAPTWRTAASCRRSHCWPRCRSRAQLTRRTSGANKVSALFTKLATDLDDPLERLAELSERNKHAKDHHNAISADSLQDWAEFAAPRTFGLAVRAYAGLGLADRLPVAHNLVISNVPGPPGPLYLCGARIEALYPLGPVFHGAGLNITVLSNAGQLHAGRSPAVSRCPTPTRWSSGSRPSWRR